MNPSYIQVAVRIFNRGVTKVIIFYSFPQLKQNYFCKLDQRYAKVGTRMISLCYLQDFWFNNSLPFNFFTSDLCHSICFSHWIVSVIIKCSRNMFTLRFKVQSFSLLSRICRAHMSQPAYYEKSGFDLKKKEKCYSIHSRLTIKGQR